MTDIRLDKRYISTLGGCKILASRFLTMDGPEVTVLNPQFRKIMARNYNRWGSRPLSGGVRLEPLDFTYRPQVPSDRVILLKTENTMLMHPAVLDRLESSLTSHNETEISGAFYGYSPMKRTSNFEEELKNLWRKP